MIWIPTQVLTGKALDLAVGVTLGYRVNYKFEPSSGFSLTIQEGGALQAREWEAKRDRGVRLALQQVTSYHLAGEWSARHATVESASVSGASDQATAEKRCWLLSQGVTEWQTPRELL